MSFLAKLIVQKRAEPLFRLCYFPSALTCTQFRSAHAHRHTRPLIHTYSHRRPRNVRRKRDVHSTHTHTHTRGYAAPVPANPLISVGVHPACGTFRQHPPQIELRLSH